MPGDPNVPTALDFPHCRECQAWEDAGASWPRPCKRHYGGEPTSATGCTDEHARFCSDCTTARPRNSIHCQDCPEGRPSAATVPASGPPLTPITASRAAWPRSEHGGTSLTETAGWCVIANSAGFYGVDGIAQNAADAHCSRYGHTPAVADPVAIGSVARCTGCGRSVALLREERNDA